MIWVCAIVVLAHQVGKQMSINKSANGITGVIYLGPVKQLTCDFLADSIHAELDASMKT
jgi:hypothetical protein